MSDSSGEGENQSYPQGNGTHDKNWEWIACVYDMKRSTAESEITWNLSPSIMLTLPSEQNVQPKVDLIIESSKSFIFSDGLGWNWHKSWNIPDIHCTLDIRDPLTNEKLLPPSKIYAEIYVVRAVINQIHTFHLVDVGIKGINRSEFESSRCVFTGLKFDTTSYNHEGSKFHLIIVVYLNQNKFEHPKILESRISPPIFVDSRKSARDTQQQKAQKLSSFIDPFLPENMDKKFIKRESKRKYNQDESIDNNIEGLSNFFSAPNIRHKVKHPLFLAVKFSNCVKIYYNTNIIPYTNIWEDNLINNEKFVEVMQKQLMEAYNRSGTNNSLNIEEKPLILTIEHQLSAQNFKQKKINEFLEPLHGDVLHVMIDSVNIPKNFKKLEDIEGVKEAYKKVYPKISQQKFPQAGGDDDDDDDDSGQQKPVARGKKAKVEKDAKKQNLSNDSDDEYAGSQATKKIKQNDADSSQVNSMIESKKLMIANPAQQSEIILSSASQNNQNVANMILLGAKPSKDKMPKGPSAPPSDKPAVQAPTKQEDSLAKGAKGKGKRASKNAAPGPAPAAASSEPNSAPTQPQPPQIIQPNQAQQFPQSVGVPPSNIQGGAQTPSNAAYMQWQQMQSGAQIQQANPSMAGNNLNKPQQVLPNGAEMPKQQGVTPNLQGNIQNFPGQYGAQPGQTGAQFAEGIGFEGAQKQAGGMNYPPQSSGFRLPGAPGQVQGSMQNYNGAAQNPAGQRSQHPSSQGYPSQLQTPGMSSGQYVGSQQPSQAAMQNAQYAAALEKGQSKQNFEDPALALNRNSSAVPAPFKHPQSINGAIPHLNQSQHYIQPGAQGEGAEIPDSMKPSYPNSQIPNSLISQQYGGQPGQYELYQRNSSQQFVGGLPSNPQQVSQPQSLQQQQQQGRFLSQQQQQQQQLAQKQFGSTASSSTPGAGGPGPMAHFYENQLNSQFSQHPHSSGITDPVSQQYGANQMQVPSYQVMPGANGGYPEDEEGSSYQTYNNRYPAASQGGSFPFGQGPVGGQGGQYYANSGYPPHQQAQQPTMGGQPYGYAQSQYGNYYQGMDPSGQQQYMKPNMNPQFQQFYSQQPQGGVQPDMVGGASNLQYQSQIRPHSSSIPQNYFGPANGGKEDDF